MRANVAQVVAQFQQKSYRDLGGQELGIDGANGEGGVGSGEGRIIYAQMDADDVTERSLISKGGTSAGSAVLVKPAIAPGFHANAPAHPADLATRPPSLSDHDDSPDRTHEVARIVGE